MRQTTCNGAEMSDKKISYQILDFSVSIIISHYVRPRREDCIKTAIFTLS